MRILAVSDMHGELEVVRRLVTRFAPDLLLCAGDWGDPGQVGESDLLFLTERCVVLTIFGNHDDLAFIAAARNSDASPVLLSQGEVREQSGLQILGISGIWAKSHRMPYYITDTDVASMAEGVSGRHVDLLITHGCPIGLADQTPSGKPGGQRCFLEANSSLKPSIHLCGHLHRMSSRRLRDGRAVINIGQTAQGDYLLLEGESAQPLNEWRITQDREHIHEGNPGSFP